MSSSSIALSVGRKKGMREINIFVLGGEIESEIKEIIKSGMSRMRVSEGRFMANKTHDDFSDASPKKAAKTFDAKLAP